MLTSKERAELRAQANGLDTTLMVGKEGVTESVLAQADSQLTARELIKGRVLETAFLSATEAADAICAVTGAEAVQMVGSKFVIYRLSEKKRQAEAAKLQKNKPERRSTANPVRKGVQKRRLAAKREREKRDEYFHEAAVKAAIEKRRAEKKG